MEYKLKHFTPLYWLLCFVLTPLVFFLGSTDSQAAMFVCKDKLGKVSYTNAPVSADCQIFLKKKKGGGARHNRGRKVHGSGLYDRDIVRVSRRYNVDPYLIKAIIQTESDFDHRAVSKHGAQGLMQLMPETAKELSVFNPFNPQENINGGTRYFRDLLEIFDGNIKLSLAAYNAGPGTVRRAQGVPPIPETIRYVKKVLRQYRAYKTLGGT